jgi:hypothetical protein
MTEMTLGNNLEELLPDSLQNSQEAIDLPEVEEMVKALSAYGLGVFMPHMHDDETGGFQVLPAGVTSVEEDLQVSFRPSADLPDEGTRRYVPVGWVWDSERGVTPAMACAVEGTLHKSG